MFRILAVVLLVASCVEADLVPCGPLSCPSGQLCVDGARCVTQHAIDECGGRPTGESCSVDNLAGRCTDLADVRFCEPATCGDGVIDPPLHEACDGAALFTAQCVDLGYDLGRPACATDCTLNPAPCTRFGWDTVVDAQVSAMWTDGTILAYATRVPDQLVVRGGGFDVTLAMRVDQIEGGGGRVFARSSERVFELTSAGAIDITPPTTLLASIRTIAVASDGMLYALDACSIARFAMSWAALASGTGSCVSIHVGLGGRVFVQTDASSIVELAGTGFQYAFNADGVINAVRFTDTDAYVATTTALTRWTADFRSQQLATGDFRSIALAGAAVYARQVDGTAVRVLDGHIDRLSPPGPLIGDDGHGHVFAFGGPLYRFSGNAFGELLPLPLGVTQAAVASTFADDGTLVAASTYAAFRVDALGGWALLTAPPYQIRALSVRSASDYLLGLHTEGNGYVSIIHHHLTNDIGAQLDADTVRGVYLSQDLTSYAVGWKGADGYLGSAPLLGSFTVTRPPDCQFHAIDGRSGRIVAGGSCHGAPSVWERANGTWTELHRETSVAGTVRSVIAIGDEIFATGDEATLHYKAGTWTVDTSVHGATLSGVATDDVWLSGSFVPVQHWDGRGWSKMTTRALGPIVVAADARRVYMPGAAKDHVSLLRDPR